jgi:hypothetical protein
MTRRYLALLLYTLLLSACGWTVNPLPPNPYYITPSRTPDIWTATPTPRILTPAGGNTPTFTPVDLTPTEVTQTDTPTSNATVTSTSTPLGAATVPINAELKVEISGCNTSQDISHQMGEVTNAYVTISNIGKGDLTNVCATLSASDEARRHPDKSQCVPSLPAGYQVSLKLTVDTGFKVDTSIQVEVTTNQEVGMTVARESCTEIGLPSPNPQFGILQPIP